MKQQLFWESQPLTEEEREKLAQMVRDEIQRQMTGALAWSWTREFFGTRDFNRYITAPQRFALRRAFGKDAILEKLVAALLGFAGGYGLGKKSSS